MTAIKNSNAAEAVTPPATGDGVGKLSQGTASQSPKAMAIMQAAKALFLEHGFGAVSMDQIARQAAVSKATVYAHFTSKEKLFAEMVFGACTSSWNGEMPQLTADSDIIAKLEETLRYVMEHLLSPEPLSVYRIIMAEGPRFPELPKAFFGNGPLPMIRKLNDFFEQANKFGLLDVPNPRVAAEQAIWLVRGPIGIRRLLDMDVPADFPGEDDYLQGAVQMIYRSFKPAGR
ncbi:MAG TPA: TetR/AcrR family transcriptional regulator [Dongiaceae bacterium]|nr:TetR/AcrR family transcriptional regulator [Dongiaceae bacterium]